MAQFTAEELGALGGGDVLRFRVRMALDKAVRETLQNTIEEERRKDSDLNTLNDDLTSILFKTGAVPVVCPAMGNNKPSPFMMDSVPLEKLLDKERKSVRITTEMVERAPRISQTTLALCFANRPKGLRVLNTVLFDSVSKMGDTTVWQQNLENNGTVEFSVRVFVRH